MPKHLSFLQELLDKCKYSAMLVYCMYVYVAAIAAHSSVMNGISPDANKLIATFLNGAKCFCPLHSPKSPSWDLALVLYSLRPSPYQFIQDVEMEMEFSEEYVFPANHFSKKSRRA